LETVLLEKAVLLDSGEGLAAQADTGYESRMIPTATTQSIS
jgi:hypothetical protein